jgi:hypothetical protein
MPRSKGKECCEAEDGSVQIAVSPELHLMITKQCKQLYSFANSVRYRTLQPASKLAAKST